ncbi:MAG TPA: YfhO family protein [Gemmatimonadaceae bacterium]|nr:YfhO family protein [Gemmatimonadaceae bacterium]
MSEPNPPIATTDDGAPRYALAWAMLVCAIAALTLAYPALSGGFLVNPHSDQYIAGYAFRDYAAQSLRDGNGFPLWNPYLYGGMPYIDAMHGDIFYPTFLLRMLLPTDIAMTWGMILHFWLAGVAMYGFLRAHRLSFHASLIGGLAYMMSGQVAGLVSPGHDGKLFISALFPVTLLTLRHGMRDGRRWAWGALALVVGLGVLTPHPQLLQYLLLASGAYALWLAYFEGGDGAPTRRVATQRLGLALGAIAIGMAIGAIQFMPLAQYTPWSPRSGGAGWEHAISYSMPPEELVNWVIPQFSGMLDAYWGRNGIHLHSEYLGFPVLLLAAAAFATKDAITRRFVWCCTGLLAVSVIWGLGGYVEPFYRIIYAIVPGTKYFRAPSTIMFISAFAVAALAAVGVQRALVEGISKRFLIVGASVLGFITLLGVTGGLTNGFEYAAMANPASPEGALQAMEANKPAVVAGAWRAAIFGAIALGLLYAVFARSAKNTVLATALAALVVADIWTVERYYWLFSPRASKVYATDAAIERIKSDSIPGRVFAIQLSREAAPNDPFLRGDGLMVQGVRHVTAYHGNELGRYQELYGGKGLQYNGVLERLGISGVFAQLTNLRWMYTNLPSLPKDYFPRMGDGKPILGPVKNAVGTDVWLYQIDGDNPPAWVVPAMMKFPDATTLEYLTTTDFPVKSVALFDTSAQVDAQQLTAIPAPLAIRARVTRYAPGSIDIELDAPAPARSALVVSENFYPGWTATVDGQPASTARADYVLIGVPLNAGARKIELRFADGAYQRGKIVTLVALALAVALAVAGAVADRKRARA